MACILNLSSINSSFKVTLLAAFVTCISINHGEPPLLKELHAECTREGISVKLWFKVPFTGIAYSNGT